jgi:hypothetical protein
MPELTAAQIADLRALRNHCAALGADLVIIGAIAHKVHFPGELRHIWNSPLTSMSWFRLNRSTIGGAKSRSPGTRPSKPLIARTSPVPISTLPFKSVSVALKKSPPVIVRSNRGGLLQGVNLVRHIPIGSKFLYLECNYRHAETQIRTQHIDIDLRGFLGHAQFLAVPSKCRTARSLRQRAAFYRTHSHPHSADERCLKPAIHIVANHVPCQSETEIEAYEDESDQEEGEQSQHTAMIAPPSVR